MAALKNIHLLAHSSTGQESNGPNWVPCLSSHKDKTKGSAGLGSPLEVLGKKLGGSLRLLAESSSMGCRTEVVPVFLLVVN